MLDRRSLIAAAFGWLLWPFAKLGGSSAFVDENGITHRLIPARRRRAGQNSTAERDLAYH
jgi:hypothetical protein